MGKIAGERTLYNGVESQEVFERPFFLHIERTQCGKHLRLRIRCKNTLIFCEVAKQKRKESNIAVYARLKIWKGSSSCQESKINIHP